MSRGLEGTRDPKVKGCLFVRECSGLLVSGHWGLRGQVLESAQSLLGKNLQTVFDRHTLKAHLLLGLFLLFRFWRGAGGQPADQRISQLDSVQAVGRTPDRDFIFTRGREHTRQLFSAAPVRSHGARSGVPLRHTSGEGKATLPYPHEVPTQGGLRSDTTRRRQKDRELCPRP